MKAIIKKMMITALLCLFISTALVQQATAQVGFQPVYGEQASAGMENSIMMGLGIGIYGYFFPKFAGTYVGMLSIASLTEGQWGPCLLGVALAYHDHTTIPEAIAAATTKDEEKKVQKKSFALNSLGTMLMISWIESTKKPKEENPEVFTYSEPENSKFFLTPYEDSVAINYHLRF